MTLSRLTLNTITVIENGRAILNAAIHIGADRIAAVSEFDPAGSRPAIPALDGRGWLVAPGTAGLLINTNPLSSYSARLTALQMEGPSQ